MQCRLDEHAYDEGIKVTSAEMAMINTTQADSHGERNYTLKPVMPDD